MDLQTRGIVLKVTDTKESDRLIYVLTEKSGMLRAFAKGARKVKSAYLAPTGLLCCSDFVFVRGKNSWNVAGASASDVFFGLRDDITAMSVAMYLAQLFSLVCPEEQEAYEPFRLLANSYALMSEKKRDPILVKACAELRLLSIEGFMPDLTCCSVCSSDKGPFYIDTTDGVLYCESCAKLSGRAPRVLPDSILEAMRYIIYSQPGKIFDFTMKKESIMQLSAVSERYVTDQIGRKLDTLDFLHSIISGEL
jgi:DNA repair protein RecO (recombination protein O)